MPRLCSWVLLALLASTQLGSSCSEHDAVPLEELQKDIPPPFDYALYCDETGTLVGKRSAVLLVYRAEHLEHVYADSRAGNSRAQALFGRKCGSHERIVYDGRGLSSTLKDDLMRVAPDFGVELHFHAP